MSSGDSAGVGVSSEWAGAPPSGKPTKANPRAARRLFIHASRESMSRASYSPRWAYLRAVSPVMPPAISAIAS